MIDSRSTNLLHMAEYLIHQSCAAADRNDVVVAVGFADCGSRVCAIAELTARPEDLPKVQRTGLELQALITHDTRKRLRQVLAPKGPVDVLINRLRRFSLGRFNRGPGRQ